MFPHYINLKAHILRLLSSIIIVNNIIFLLFANCFECGFVYFTIESAYFYCNFLRSASIFISLKCYRDFLQE